jgi:hypothetical protein
MMYAVGRELEYFDMPQVRTIVRRRPKTITGCLPLFPASSQAMPSVCRQSRRIDENDPRIARMTGVPDVHN